MAALLPKTFFQTAKRQNFAAATAVTQICNYSEKPRIIKNPTLANLRRGTGGRASFNGFVCTVFGAGGFIGRHLCNRLGKIGTQIIIPYRGEFYDIQFAKLYGDLGQVLFHPFDLRDEDSILKCIKYSNVVINLIGCDWETKNFKYNDVHVEGAARLARLCKENGVERFIHVSCLNVTAEQQCIYLKHGSSIMKSKKEGEIAVRKEFPEATIIRPSDTYGTNDRFIAVYAHKLRLQFGKIPIYKKGELTEKQPVWVGDVAAGIVAAMKDPFSAGRTYQFVGPDRFKLSDLIDWFHEMLRRESVMHGFKRIEDNIFFKLQVSLIQAVSLAYPIGYLHWEGLEKELISDNVIKGVPTLEDLGIQPIRMDNSQVYWEVRPRRYDGSYEASVHEYAEIIPPKPINRQEINCETV